MTGGFLDAIGAAAAAENNCSARGCLKDPIAVCGGERVCARHRDYLDHARMGGPCERCGSRVLIETPTAETVAVCWGCELVTYDGDVFDGSW